MVPDEAPKLDDGKPPVLTYLIGAIAAIVVAIGGIVVIVHPDTLSYKEYLNQLTEFGKAIGLLAVGKGLLGAGKAIGK